MCADIVKNYKAQTQLFLYLFGIEKISVFLCLDFE